MLVIPLLAALFLSNAAAAAPDSAKLDGQWVTACLPIGKNSRHGVIIKGAIKDDRIELAAQQYAHISCDTPTVQSNFTASIAERRAAGDHIDLELVVRSMTMTPNAEDVAELYNKWMKDNPACGAIEWREGEEVSVAGKKCDPLSFPALWSHLTMPARVDGDRLRLTGLPALPQETVFTRTEAH